MGLALFAALLLQDPSQEPRGPIVEPLEPTLKIPVYDWAIRAGYLYRSFDGDTRVREHSFVPGRLSMSEEMGIGSTTGFHAEMTRDGSWLRCTFEVDYFTVSGTGSSPVDFNYDEGHFLANRPYEVSGWFLYAHLLFTFKKLVYLGESSWIGPVVGLEYPLISMGINQPGVDQSTEEYKQFMPYPVVGLAYECQVSKTLTFSMGAYGSYFKDAPTIFTEGGTLYMTVKTFTAQASISWQLEPSVVLFIGVQYQFWDGELESHEDGNELMFMSTGVMAGIEIRW